MSSASAVEAIGHKFGRLTVIRVTRRATHGTATYVAVKCECGKEKQVRFSHLSAGATQSCGSCIRIKPDGLKKHPLYGIWCAIKRRCFNRNTPEWPYYGGRGITMCPEWAADFTVFLRDVGMRPTPDHWIDRINNDGNYEAGNIRWATAKEQANNRRPRRWWKRPAHEQH